MSKFGDHLRRVIFGDRAIDAEASDAEAVSLQPLAPEAVETELIAVLTAAATVALGRRVAVRRVTFINRNTISGWAEAGRTSIQLSHNLRRTI
jgi:hypothetical protein